jgi:ribosomal protein S18 acetylase RimI-like enzyme
MDAMAPELQTVIRPARDADLPQVLEIERRCFDKQWDLHNFKASLDDIFLVSEEAGQVIGFLIACCCRLSLRGMILRVAVDPEHQRQGVATALLQEAFHRLLDLELQDVELDVDVLKAGAIRLYQKTGFQIVEILTLDAEEDDSFYIMRKNLRDGGG